MKEQKTQTEEAQYEEPRKDQYAMEDHPSGGSLCRSTGKDERVERR